MCWLSLFTYWLSIFFQYIDVLVKLIDVLVKYIAVGLASQFAIQNCLGCYSKLNLDSKFHAEAATHLPHIKLRTLHTLNIIL